MALLIEMVAEIGQPIIWKHKYISPAVS